MTTRRQPEATVLPVHFEDRSGAEFFERRDGRVVVVFGVMRRGNAGVSAGTAS